MRTKNRTAATTTAALAAVALTSIAASSAGAKDLDWKRCSGADKTQRCTTLRVPLDYQRPHGRQITLAVSRIHSAKPGERRGVLLLVPGGPGNSGLNLPTTTGLKLPRTVRDRYDIVGFDPRGVGRSTPVSCGLAHADLSPVNLRPWPAPDGGIARNVATARRVAAACARNGGPVLRSISTVNEANDIDAIRQALGVDRISTWGVSYGTYAGAAYAQIYSAHTDHVLLDSSDDMNPALAERGWLANYALGVEDRFPDFARWASAPGTAYRLATTPAGVRTMFLDLAARLDRDPVPWPGANPPQITGNVLREDLLDALYSDQRFPELAKLILALRDGGRLPAPSSPPDQALQNSSAVSVATICNDVRWPRSMGAYARDTARSRASHPLTAGMPVNVTPCAFWPYAPEQSPVRITARGPSNVLLVQNLRDPATPYSGALNLRRSLADRARLVTVDSGGHEAYLANGNTCGDRLVTGFLLDGTRPDHDTFCTAAGAPEPH